MFMYLFKENLPEVTKISKPVRVWLYSKELRMVHKNPFRRSFIGSKLVWLVRKSLASWRNLVYKLKRIPQKQWISERLVTFHSKRRRLSCSLWSAIPSKTNHGKIQIFFLFWAHSRLSRASRRRLNMNCVRLGCRHTWYHDNCSL